MVPLDWVSARVASFIDAEVNAEGTASISKSIVSPSNWVRVIVLLAILAVLIALGTYEDVEAFTTLFTVSTVAVSSLYVNVIVASEIEDAV